MIITDIQADVLRDPGFEVRGDTSFETVVVRVFTDDAIVGIGEAASSPSVVRSIVEAPTAFTLSRAIRELLVGRDPLEIGALWEEVYQQTLYPGRRGAYIHLLSAIDIALWDILGKATKLPVYKLLGGAFQRDVRAYASLVMPCTPEEARELAAKTAAQGWPALKLGWFPAESDAATDLAFVRAAREGAGPEARLMLDVGPRWELTTGGRPAVQLWDAKTAIHGSGASPSTSRSGSRSRCRRTTSTVTAVSATPLRRTSPQARRRRPASRSSSSWIAAGSTSSSSTSAGSAASRRPAGSRRPRMTATVRSPRTASRAALSAPPRSTSSQRPRTATTWRTRCRSRCSRTSSCSPAWKATSGWVRVPEEPGLGVALDEELLERLRVESLVSG
jgi:L-rhamnonate dehydratase